jgi:hypothetical protein
LKRLTVLDFSPATGAPFGLLVKLSEHRLRQTGGAESEKRGIITEYRFYEDAAGQVICWPVVWWEGDCTGRAAHPMNVSPARDDVHLASVEMLEG